MFYGIVKALLRFIMLFVFRIKINGRENVPLEGGAIIASNHKSYWDPVMLALASPRKLSFMAKSELFKNKFFAKLITDLGAFPVHRGKGDLGAVKAALTILKGEGVMVIFPEGTRDRDDSVTEAKPGAVMLAIKSKIPIVPAYISGKYHWFSKVTVTFGKPVYYEDFYEKKAVVSELQDLSNDLLKTMRSYKIESKKRK